MEKISKGKTSILLVTVPILFCFWWGGGYHQEAGAELRSMSSPHSSSQGNKPEARVPMHAAGRDFIGNILVSRDLLKTFEDIDRSSINEEKRRWLEHVAQAYCIPVSMLGGFSSILTGEVDEQKIESALWNNKQLINRSALVELKGRCMGFLKSRSASAMELLATMMADRMPDAYLGSAEENYRGERRDEARQDFLTAIAGRDGFVLFQAETVVGLGASDWQEYSRIADAWRLASCEFGAHCEPGSLSMLAFCSFQAHCDPHQSYHDFLATTLDPAALSAREREAARIIRLLREHRDRELVP